MGGARSGCGGKVDRRWGVDWYHPCERGMAGSGVGPPTRLEPIVPFDKKPTKWAKKL